MKTRALMHASLTPVSVSLISHLCESLFVKHQLFATYFIDRHENKVSDSNSLPYKWPTKQDRNTFVPMEVISPAITYMNSLQIPQHYIEWTDRIIYVST